MSKEDAAAARVRMACYTAATSDDDDDEEEVRRVLERYPLLTLLTRGGGGGGGGGGGATARHRYHRARLLTPLVWWLALEMFWQIFFYLVYGTRQTPAYPCFFVCWGEVGRCKLNPVVDP
jgi:hypothetical protein